MDRFNKPPDKVPPPHAESESQSKNVNKDLSSKARTGIGIAFAGLLLAPGADGRPTPESSGSALSVGDGQNPTSDLSTMIPTKGEVSDSRSGRLSPTPYSDRVVSQITGDASQSQVKDTPSRQGDSKRTEAPELSKEAIESLKPFVDALKQYHFRKVG